MANPVKLAVGEGSDAKFECAAIGNLIERMEWSRDVGETMVCTSYYL